LGLGCGWVHSHVDNLANNCSVQIDLPTVIRAAREVEMEDGVFVVAFLAEKLKLPYTVTVIRSKWQIQ